MKSAWNPKTLLVSAWAGTNLLVMGLSAFWLMESYDRYEQNARTLAQNIATAIDQSVSNTIERIDIALRTLTDLVEQSHNDKKFDDKTLADLLTRYELRMPEIEGFRVTDDQGLLLLGNGISKADGVSVAGREYFNYLHDNADNNLVISPPLFGRVKPHFIMIFAHRYNRWDGHFAGLVYATVPMDEINKMVTGFELGPQGAIALRDRNLGLVTRFPLIKDPTAVEGNEKFVSADLRKLVESGVRAASFHPKETADGVDRIVAFRKLSKAQMFAIVRISASDYLVPWYSERRRTLAMDIGFFVLSSLASLMFSRSLSATLRASRRNRAYLGCARDGMHVLDPSGKCVEASDSFCLLLGYSRDELLRMNASQFYLPFAEGRGFADWSAELQSQTAPVTFETHLRGRDGQLIEAEISGMAVELDGQSLFFCSTRDIAELRRAEEKIIELAYFDPLTGLANRLLLADRVKQAMASSQRRRTHCALLFIDLDGFKAINDRLGHANGDRLLREVGERLSLAVRAEDSVARLGGDEFVLLLTHLSRDSEEAAAHTDRVAKKIIAALAAPYEIEHILHRCGASIGATLFRGAVAPLDDLLRQADLAMYKAKSAGGSNIKFFDPAMEIAVLEKAEMIADLREAVNWEHFLLYYQPQVRHDGRLIGAEILLRWDHPQRGPISPRDFIPLAEETGLILPLGQFVLRQACQQLALWADLPEFSNLTLAVNISAKQFRQPDFALSLIALLTETGAPPQRLKLELTESLMVDNVEDVIAKLVGLKAAGVTFSLDDFGTGYSSLAYLKRMPVDQLKIDQTFTSGILVNAHDLAITTSIINLAQSLGLDVLAEGVESGEQRDALARHGCDSYQGFFFSRPIPEEQFLQLVRENFVQAAR